MNSYYAEKAVLANLILDWSNASYIFAQLNEKHFMHKDAREVFKVAYKRFLDHKNFVITDVAAEYPTIKEYISFLVDVITMSDDFSTFSDRRIDTKTAVHTLKLLASNNRLVLMCRDVEKMLKVDKAENVYASFQTLLTELQSDLFVKPPKNIYDSVYKRHVVNKQENFIDFGFDNLNKIQPGELIVVGARTGMGKTTFALQVLLNLILQEKKVILFSLEMRQEDIVDKLLANITEIPYKEIAENSYPKECEEGLLDNAKELSQMKNLVICEEDCHTINAIEAIIERNKDNLSCVIIDHLQLLDGVGDSRYAQVTMITKTLKRLALKYKCAILLVSQLVRNAETKDRPTLADLRDSGSIEQDSDRVILLYRPNYYDKDSSVPATEEPIEINLAKNRRGAIVTMDYFLDLTTGRFSK